MRRSIWPLILAGFAGSVLVGIWGRDQGWSPLETFIGQAVFLAVLGMVRKGVTRLFMAVLITLQALPVFGLGTVLAVAVPAFLLAFAVMWRIYIGKFSTMNLSPRRDQAIAERARGHVNELRQVGYQTVGSVDASGPGFETIFTYLLAPDKRTFAVVTDEVQTLSSQFGSRLLVTMDRASLPTPPGELRQVVATHLPGMIEAHERALAALEELGFAPDPLDSARLLDQAREAEERSTVYLASRPWWVGWQVLKGRLTRRRPDSALVGPDQDRIKRWWASS